MLPPSVGQALSSFFWPRSVGVDATLVDLQKCIEQAAAGTPGIAEHPLLRRCCTDPAIGSVSRPA